MPSRLATPTTLEAVHCLKKVGRGSKGLPQPLGQGPCSPFGSGGCSPFQSEPSRWQTPGPLRAKSSASEGAPPPQPRAGHPKLSASSVPQTLHSTPATRHRHTRRPAPHPGSPWPPPQPGEGPPTSPYRHTHTLRFQSFGPRRSRSEYLVRQSSEAQMGRARSPPGGAECFSTHPQWWLLFPRSGREERCGRGGGKRGAEGM